MLTVESWRREVIINLVNLETGQAIDWRLSPLPNIANNIEKFFAAFRHRAETIDGAGRRAVFEINISGSRLPVWLVANDLFAQA